MMIQKLIGYFRGLLTATRVKGWQPFRLDGALSLSRVHGDLIIGRKAHLWPGVKISISGTPEHRASVSIGSQSSIGDRTQIHACRSVHIGDRVLISWDVNILENNYHAKSKGPIRIEDDVWIACRAIILHGVTIGKGAIVGAGAVVVKDVPPNTFVAGNPAVAIRAVTPEFRREVTFEPADVSQQAGNCETPRG